MNLRISLCLVMIYLCSAPIALADEASPKKHGLLVSGNIRSYYFTRSFRKGTDQAAFSLGGNFHIQGDFADGIGAGLTYGTANPLGANSANPARVDATLPATTVSVLEEAYLQYHTDYVGLRVGRQKISTPWALPSDSRIIPNAFQGVGANAKISKAWMLVADRMVRYKSRVVSTFDANDNLSTLPTTGLLAVGGVYSQSSASAQAWYYDFYGTAQMAYVDATQRFLITRKFRPYAAAQYVAEAGKTQRLMGNVDAHGYGINLGVQHDRGDLSLAYNDVSFSRGSYKGGGIASPYTYADTDPLYTTVTGTGLVDKGAGHAYRVAGTVWSYHNKLRATAARAEYYLYGASKFPNNHVLATNLDVTYFLGNGKRGEAFRGLSIRDRWIDIDTPGSPFTFINNRAQLEYDF
jgi:hypothetical protein